MRCSASARSLGGVEPQVVVASRAAATAWSASSAPPRATSAIGCSSIGETSVNVVGDATRAPPNQCSVETWMPSTTVSLVVLPSPRQRTSVRSFVSERYWGQGSPVKPGQQGSGEEEAHAFRHQMAHEDHLVRVPVAAPTAEHALESLWLIHAGLTTRASRSPARHPRNTPRGRGWLVLAAPRRSAGVPASARASSRTAGSDVPRRTPRLRRPARAS